MAAYRVLSVFVFSALFGSLWVNATEPSHKEVPEIDGITKKTLIMYETDLPDAPRWHMQSPVAVFDDHTAQVVPRDDIYFFVDTRHVYPALDQHQGFSRGQKVCVLTSYRDFGPGAKVEVMKLFANGFAAVRQVQPILQGMAPWLPVRLRDLGTCDGDKPKVVDKSEAKPLAPSASTPVPTDPSGTKADKAQ